MRFPAVPILLVLPVLAGCVSAPARQPHETDVACIHRLYDYPNRAEPFAVAAGDCAGSRTVDLTGDRYFQLKARTLNIPFVDRQPGSITLTGSRVPQSTDEPAPPELSLH